MKYSYSLKWFSVLTACLATVSALAAERVVVEKVTKIGATKPLYVSLTGITGQAAQILQFDLYVQGFAFTNEANAQYLIDGSANGNLTARVRDKFNGTTPVSKSYSGGSLRRQVHTFADEFVNAIGQKGIALTQVAFKNDTGANSEVFISDFDGANAQAVTRDNTIVAAPAWVPGRMALYYTSYKFNRADIFHHNLSTGDRKAFARHGGDNLSPAPSPDGSKVVMILSKDGWPDLYVGDAGGGMPRRLTKSREDESSPCWSPDGKWICFATRMKGRRVLAKVPAEGGDPVRIPTDGESSPTEPDWSPDGKWIVFTSATRGGFNICVIPAEGGTATALVGGEDPSFAPNSRTVIFTRRNGAQRSLSLLDVLTKQYKDISRISGTTGRYSQPSWAK